MITVIRGGDGVSSDLGSSTFTGEVWRDRVMTERDGVQMGNNFFAPGARTHWHSHPGGQALLVVAGEGLVGEEGREPYRVTVGDIIWTPPGVRHWHGATPDRFLVHTAITIGGVTWQEPVEDEQYRSS